MHGPEETIPKQPPLAGLRGLLAVGFVTITALGLAAELAFHRAGLSRELNALFSLSFEANVPTWYSTVLLFTCGALLGLAASRARRVSDPFRWHFAGLAALFSYFSLDEAIEIHEHLGGHLDLGGLLYFDWVVPAALFVLLVGLVYARFLFHLPPGTRRGFVVAGVVYVSGALLMELPLGYWTERAGDENLTYALIDFVEESLEIAGSSYFVLVLARYLAPREVAGR
jgi:hypothetical protein